MTQSWELYPLTTDLSDDFLIDVDAMCTRLGCSTPDMVGLMESESQISSAAHNPHGATGLVQFDVWDGHGLLQMPDGRHLTWQSVAAMSDEEQLGEVEAFFHGYRGHLSKPGQLYTVCFIPVAATNPRFGPGFVVCGTRPGDPFPQFQRANPGFDRGHKGYTTADDMAARTAACAALPRAKEALARIAVLAAASSSSPPPGYGA